MLAAGAPGLCVGGCHSDANCALGRQTLAEHQGEVTASAVCCMHTRSVVELETEVFGQREELNKQEEARQQLEAMLEQQGVEMQEEASEEEEGEEEKEAQPQPPMLSADVVNTKAYLLWIENGRPDGADFGHAAYTWLVEAFHDGRCAAHPFANTAESQCAIQCHVSGDCALQGGAA